MKQILPMLCILLIVWSCKQESKKYQSVHTPDTSSFQAIVDSIFAAHPQATGVVAHIESPKHGISWSGGAGFANKADKSPLQAAQTLLIASNIKTYIAASVLRLQEEGKLDIEDAIEKHLTPATQALFRADGYALDQIKIKHLLSHTSGIADYVNDDYISFINSNPKHRWTRDEQLQRAVAVGDPLGAPAEVFRYADVNYLLATEIIEQLWHKPFYTAVRELLKWDELGFENTWFPTLEDRPTTAAERLHQYWHEDQWGEAKLQIAWDSYDHDISWDLYGGGGIATNMRELAQFSQQLFQGNIVQSDRILQQLTTDMPTTDSIPKTYRLGVSEVEIKGLKAYGHGGFWGTNAFYFPELDATIAVGVLERKDKMKTIEPLIHSLVAELSRQQYTETKIKTEHYILYKAKNSKATLVLFPGGGSDAAYTQKEFDIVALANANQLSVAFMEFNRHIWIEEADSKTLEKQLESLCTTHQLAKENLCIGGMSIGGNVALSFSNYLVENQAEVAPKAVFVVDSPIDLYAMYQSAIADIKNPDFDAARLEEPRFIKGYFEDAFSKDNLLENIQETSPFVHQTAQTSVGALKHTALRFYTEPDALWWQENRQTDFVHTNAYAIQEVAKQLRLNEEKEANLTKAKEVENEVVGSPGAKSSANAMQQRSLKGDGREQHPVEPPAVESKGNRTRKAELHHLNMLDKDAPGNSSSPLHSTVVSIATSLRSISANANASAVAFRRVIGALSAR